MELSRKPRYRKLARIFVDEESPSLTGRVGVNRDENGVDRCSCRLFQENKDCVHLREFQETLSINGQPRRIPGFMVEHLPDGEILTRDSDGNYSCTCGQNDGHPYLVCPHIRARRWKDEGW